MTERYSEVRQPSTVNRQASTVNPMLISIITATFNSAATVAETMQSVEAQDYPHIEHIVVDGHSQDDTLEIIEQYPHTATLISEKDEGIYDAMNKGIRAATGDIIGILNSDDIYAHEKVISKVARVFLDPGVQACYADIQYTDAQNTSRITRTWKAGAYNEKSFYWGWMPPHPGFFVRKAVYDQVGLFDTSLRSAADYEMMLRILVKRKMKAVYIPEVIVKMRTGGMSNASVKNRIRANREDRAAWRLNGLKPYFFTLYLKPLRKITQFLKK
jgi:glycosyltransferase involved in cell wall biosynthesis